MIRQAYNWNSIFDFGSGTLELLFHFSAGSGNLDGQARLASIWIADFRRLFDFREAGRDGLAVPAAQFNRAMRIDTRLSDPLRTLPGFTDEDNLAIRNLMRAKMVRLATGQQMAAFLRNKGVSVTTLTRAQIARATAARARRAHGRPARCGAQQHAPLVLHPARSGARKREAQRRRRASSPRRSTAPWRGARSPSSASPTGARRSA